MAAQSPNPPWFHKLLAAAKKQAGSRAALARSLGDISPGTISSWEDDATSPTLDKFVALLDFTKGDIRRALPEWQPYPEASEAVRQENRELRAKVDELKDMLAAIQEITVGGVGVIPRKHHIPRRPGEIRGFVLNEPPRKTDKE